MLPENSRAVFVAFVFIYLPHDYNNYKRMPKKCRNKMARKPKGHYRAYVN